MNAYEMPVLAHASGWALLGAFQATDQWAFAAGSLVVFVSITFEALSRIKRGMR